MLLEKIVLKKKANVGPITTLTFGTNIRTLYYNTAENSCIAGGERISTKIVLQ